MSIKCCNVVYSPRIVTNGLVGYWDAGNPKSYPGSGTIWYDLCGNNHATFTNTPTYSNNRISFNGSYYAITSNYSFINSTDAAHSLFAWVYPNDNTSSRMIISYGEYTDSQYASGLYLRADKTLCWHVDGGREEVTYCKASTYVVQSNQPVMIGFTRTGTSTSFFFNNQTYTTSLSVAGTIITTNPFTIGCGSSNSNKPLRTFIGEMSNVLAYNRALSAAEVQQNFNALRGRFGI